MKKRKRRRKTLMMSVSIGNFKIYTKVSKYLFQLLAE